MNILDAETYVAKLAKDAMNEIVKRQFFALIFVDKEGELHCYDTRNPANCLKSVADKNPDFEFVHAIAETTDQAVRSLCMTLRTARSIRSNLKDAIDKRMHKN